MRLKATGFFRALNAEKTAEPRLRAARRRRRAACACCWSITTIASSTRSPITPARPAPKWSPTAPGFPPELIDKLQPSLILVSPGPGRPADFGVPDLVRYAAQLGIPVFGVCLGLQGMVEAFGGELGVLDYPMHGKPSLVRHRGVGVFEGLPEEFQVGRYHSLYALREKLPAAWKSPRRAKTASSWACAIASCRWKPCSSIPNRSSRWKETAACKLMENVVRHTGALASRGRSLGYSLRYWSIGHLPDLSTIVP